MKKEMKTILFGMFGMILFFSTTAMAGNDGETSCEGGFALVCVDGDENIMTGKKGKVITVCPSTENGCAIKCMTQKEVKEAEKAAKKDIKEAKKKKAAKKEKKKAEKKKVKEEKAEGKEEVKEKAEEKAEKKQKKKPVEEFKPANVEVVVRADKPEPCESGKPCEKEKPEAAEEKEGKKTGVSVIITPEAKEGEGLSYKVEVVCELGEETWVETHYCEGVLDECLKQEWCKLKEEEEILPLPPIPLPLPPPPPPIPEKKKESWCKRNPGGCIALATILGVVAAGGVGVGICAGAGCFGDTNVTQDH